MDTAEKVREALKSWKEGDLKFGSGDFEGSVRSYTRALDVAKSLPNDEPFNHLGFAASCTAGLSGALGRLDRHQESLAAAESALSIFDRHGTMHTTEVGKWMMAIVNKGTALVMLGRPREALDTFRRAKKMFSDLGMDIYENKQWIAMVDQNISTVEAMLGNLKSK